MNGPYGRLPPDHPDPVAWGIENLDIEKMPAEVRESAAQLLWRMARARGVEWKAARCIRRPDEN